MKFIRPAFILCLLILAGCGNDSNLITKTTFDPAHNCFLFYNNDSAYPGGILHDTNNRIIRNEADKERFVSNFNAYEQLSSRDKTNSFYNDYLLKPSYENIQNHLDVNFNYDCSCLYF